MSTLLIQGAESHTAWPSKGVRTSANPTPAAAAASRIATASLSAAAFMADISALVNDVKRWQVRPLNRRG